MASQSKTDYCAYRSILALLFALQEYLVTFKFMTSQVVQRARIFTSLTALFDPCRKITESLANIAGITSCTSILINSSLRESGKRFTKFNLLTIQVVAVVAVVLYLTSWMYNHFVCPY